MLWIIALLSTLTEMCGAFAPLLSKRHSVSLAFANDDDDDLQNNLSSSRERLRLVRLRASAELRLRSKRTKVSLMKRVVAMRKSIAQGLHPVEKIAEELEESQISLSALDNLEDESEFSHDVYLDDDSLWEQFLPEQQYTLDNELGDCIEEPTVGEIADELTMEHALYEQQYADECLQEYFDELEVGEGQLMANEALLEELLEDAEASVSDGSMQMEETTDEKDFLSGEDVEEAKETEPALEAETESGESASAAAEMVEQSVYKAQDFFSENGWALKNDFYTFLNQCSIQSFSFLLKSMHDPQTALWIDAFTKPTIEDTEKPGYAAPEDFVQPGKTLEEDCKLLSYHGLNAIDTELFPTWDAYFEELAQHPTEIYTVESSTAQAPDYELDINPIRLCNRLLAVREQIALEFVNDLQVLSEMSGQTVVAYWDSVKEDEEKEGEEDPEDERNIDDIMAKDGREIKIESGNLMFLDISVKPGTVPSPLRKGNFDLLKLMATQEAIHRVLNDPERQEGAGLVSNNFLRDFYAARFSTFFDGNVQYGGALKFMQELFEEAPVFREVDGKTALIDPVRLAGMVLAKREEVSLEWKELAAVVPDEHLAIQRFLLTGDIIGAAAPGLSFEEALRAGSCEEDNTNTVPWGDADSIPEVTDEMMDDIIRDQEEVVEQMAQINATSVFE